VLLLPSLISSSFGFTQIHYIIDYVEYLRGTLQLDHPFVASHDTVEISDYFKDALSMPSFICAAAKSEDALAVSQSPESSLDLLRNATFDHTLSLVDPGARDRDLMVNLEGEPRLVRVTIDDCAGCPVFLSFWEEIWREIDEIDEPWNVDIRQYTDAQAFGRECQRICQSASSSPEGKTTKA
jgi:hypothetical protein